MKNEQDELTIAKLKTQLEQERVKTTEAQLALKQLDEMFKSQQERISAIIKQAEKGMSEIREKEATMKEFDRDFLNKHLSVWQEETRQRKQQLEQCRKALANATKAIYNWSEVLTKPDANYDYASLFDYIGKCLQVVDNYIGKENLTNNK